MTGAPAGDQIQFMFWRSLFLLFLAILPVTGLAQTPLSAAGRLENIEKEGTCSAALVAPDVILTAAHCVARTEEEDERPLLVFRPGNVTGERVFAAKKIVLHPLYDPANDPVRWRLRFDLAVVQLSEAVPGEIATPFAVGDEAFPGEDLVIVSWRRDESVRPRQRACPVLSGVKGLVTLGCRVQGGESGAPVVRRTPSGVELVAIVSSRSRIMEQPVAQASDVRLRLQPLLDLLR